jgi:NOL1/NOP2/fmu family ribosome biogenesis protein
LKQGGVIIYSTCSYSKEENEDVLDWICDELSIQSLPLHIDPSWNIISVQSDKHKAHGYRFFPDKVRGEGFFIACMRKEDGGESQLRPPKKSLLQKTSKNEIAIITPWLRPGLSIQLWKQGDRILAFPAAQEAALMAITDKMYVRSAGISMGKIAGNDLVPDHALAVSTLLGDEIVTVSLKKASALQYLRKEEVNVESTHKGWALVQYEEAALGWVKLLQNRINNYYPSNWRILKTG